MVRGGPSQDGFPEPGGCTPGPRTELPEDRGPWAPLRQRPSPAPTGPQLLGSSPLPGPEAPWTRQGALERLARSRCAEALADRLSCCLPCPARPTELPREVVAETCPGC